MNTRPSMQTRPPSGTSNVAAPTPVSRLPPRPTAPNRSISAHHSGLSADRKVPFLAKSSPANAPELVRSNEKKQLSGLVIDLTSGDGESKRATSPDGVSADALSDSRASQAAESGSAETEDAKAQSANVQNQQQKWEGRGRPIMRFVDAMETEVDGQRSASAPAHASEPLPFPPRPGQQANTKLHHLHQAMQSMQPQSRQKATSISGIVTLDPPAESRKYPCGNPADFSPWTSADPSEHLTPALIKNGLASTPLVSVHDSNTARPSLWSSLKNKNGGGGLSTLATLLCSVIERRQQLGKLTAPSTFKPPPRVALTDKSRETWLLELANPQVPLKKLSRRIPHGIRGKGLLEECMNKKIPLARAVWLAKCVGAQEMRAFKRKGAGASTTSVAIGGEAKFIKEWTMQVQQFLEYIIGACGTHGWKVNIEYAIRLASFLYAEHLLDNDQFLEWILSSLEESGTDRLPLWLVLTHIYFNDLATTRRKGRRLAEAILLHINALVDTDDADICKPLYQKLRQMAAEMLVKHRACFIALKNWEKCQSVLKTLAGEERTQHPVIGARIKKILRRNETLLKTGRANDVAAVHGVKRLIVVLDGATVSSSALSFRIEPLWKQCLEAGVPGLTGIQTTLQWASSQYRSGEERTYLAARLVRLWKRNGHDVDDAILSLLKIFSDSNMLGVDEPCLFKVIEELCRSQTFSVGKYLQWLIASGALASKGTLQESFHKRLLLALPVHAVPSHLVNLRDILLSSLGVSTDEERDRIEYIRKRIQSVSLMDTGSSSTVLGLHLAGETLPTKLGLSRWTRQEVSLLHETVLECVGKDSPNNKPTEQKTSRITLTQFQLARTLLEELEHLSILADVLALSLTSNDTSVLAACADTLNLHANAFAAIGALGPLFKTLFDRHGYIRSVQPLDRGFVSALHDLAKSNGGDDHLCEALKLDLSRCEQRAVVQMCSPASDGMGEVLSMSKGSDFGLEEEVERVLNSGNSMDEGAAGRVFSRIVEVMSKVAVKKESQDVEMEEEKREQLQTPPFEAWFQKLRALDERVFERLVGEWVTGLLSEQTPGQSPLLSFAVPTLVGAGVASLRKIEDGAKKMIETFMRIAPKQAAGPALNLLIILIDGILPRHAMVDEQHWYRYRVDRQRLQDSTLMLLRLLLGAISKSPTNVHDKCIVALLTSGQLLANVRRLAIRDVQSTAFSLGVGSGSATSCSGTKQQQQQQANVIAQGYIEQLLYNLLDPSQKLQMARLSKEEQVRKIIDVADDFSLPFCQLQIRSLLSTPSLCATPNAMIGGQDDVENALLDALKAAINRPGSSWAELLSGFGDAVCGKVRQFAEQKILAAMDDVWDRLQDPERHKKDSVTLKRYISVVDASTPSGSSRLTEPPQHLAMLTEKLKLLVEVLNKWQESPQVSWRPSAVHQLCVWIDALVHLCVTHKHSLVAANASEQLNLGAVLCSLMLHPLLVFSAETVERIFDLLAFLSDDLSADVRMRLSKAEGQRHNIDSRISFLFGFTTPPDSWLGLVTSISTSSSSNIPATTSTPKASGFSNTPRPSSPAQPPSTRGISHQTPPQIQRQSSGQQRLPGATGNVPSRPGPMQQPHIGQRPGHAGSYGQHVQARQAQQTWPPMQHQQQAAQLQRQHGQNMQSQFGLGQRSAGNGPQHAQGQAQNAQQRQPNQQQQAPNIKEKVQFNPPVPFPLRRWEILPDASGTGPGGGTAAMPGTARDVNDTAISLTLFGARKVV